MWKFVCFVCGNNKSDELDKDEYIRLRPGNKWVCEGCKEDSGFDEERPHKGGYIMKERDF